MRAVFRAEGIKKTLRLQTYQKNSKAVFTVSNAEHSRSHPKKHRRKEETFIVPENAARMTLTLNSRCPVGGCSSIVKAAELDAPTVIAFWMGRRRTPFRVQQIKLK